MNANPGIKVKGAVERRFKGRLILLLLAVTAWTAIILGRLINLQVLRSDELRLMAERQQRDFLQVAPDRGRILDSRMRDLALGCKISSIFASPPEMADTNLAALKLAKTLRLNRRDLLSKLSAEGRSFVWIKRKVEKWEADSVAALGLKGVYFLEENGRKYPTGMLAANVLGYVGMDNSGLSGLEHACESLLAGQACSLVRIRDARGQRLLEPRAVDGRAVPGNDLVLTIDQVLQYYAEKELQAGMELRKAKSGMVVVMNPWTGEVLAMAVRPSFDPASFADASRDAWRNRPVTDCFEPGSVMKVFVMAGCLEKNLVRLTERIDCGRGSIKVAGVVIHDHKPFDNLDPIDVIAHSSNVGAIRLGLRLGAVNLHDQLKAFGFGTPTGVDFPGETSGILRPVTEWSGISAASISIGQELSVSTLQLATAMSAIANGGILMKPLIVWRELAPDGRLIASSSPQRTGRVISRGTASTLTMMMTGVVERGTGKKAAVPGFHVAGKTGTAQKAGRDGTYEADKYFSLFAGFAPARNPVVTVVVALDEPLPPFHHGGDAAAPVFSAVAAAALRYLDIPPEEEIERKDDKGKKDRTTPPEIDRHAVVAQAGGREDPVESARHETD